MKVSFQDSRSEVRSFLRLYIKERIFQVRNLFWLLLFPAMIAYSIVFDPFKWWKVVLAFTIISSSFLFIFYLIPYIRMLRNIKDVPEEVRQAEITVELKDDGIHAITHKGHRFLYWNTVKTIEMNEKFLYFFFIDHSFFSIPLEAFPNHAAALNFLAEARSKRYGPAQLPGPVTRKQNKPPYLVGLLCLIPNLGVIAGIVLVVLGIFTYKNKWLVLIGLSGPLFTFLFWQATETGFNSPSMKSQWASRGLTELVKDIEFYKVRNGIYPDSLQELKEGSKPIWNSDPTADNEKQTYIYKRVNDTAYLLYSPGLDKVPNTADDIHPSVNVGNMNRVGLIKKKDSGPFK